VPVDINGTYAEPFTLTAPATVQGIWTQPSSIPDAGASVVYAAFYSDSNGSPSARITTAATGAYSTDSSGNIGFQISLPLNAGSYWVAVSGFNSPTLNASTGPCRRLIAAGVGQPPDPWPSNSIACSAFVLFVDAVVAPN
jgi:hypothetical protein